jgi:hypothetical protein
MKTRNVVGMLAIGALALGVAASRPAVAKTPVAGIIGQTASSVAGCPNVMWRLARHDDGTITGIFFYSDLSGTSEAKGIEDATGRFHIQLTSAMGNGPVGVVDGQRAKDGKVVADLVGQGCANDHFLQMRTVTDLDTAGSVGG